MQEISIPLSNSTIAGLQFGQSDKPLIVALHGWLDNAASFIPLAEYLGDYHIIALDLPGHGHSSNRSVDAHYHFIDYVQDLHEVILVQGWRDFVLLGHSMGGIVASLYASCFPEIVGKYITIESFGPMTKPADSCTQQLRESVETRIGINKKEAKHPQNLDAVIKARAKAGEFSYDSAKLLVERNLEQQGGELLWRTDRRLRTISSLLMTDEQVEAFLRNIQCQVLAISGSKGYEFMRKRLAQRKSFVKNLRTESCAGGHHVHMDNPEDVANAIKQFLQQ